MKKTIVIFSFILLLLTAVQFTVKANTTEEILYKYGTNTPVTFSNSTTPVTIPTETKYFKQEFRGVWITTIWNLDMPKHTSQTQYKAEFIKILDLLDAYNMNVLLFQVRPKNDAMYESNLNPWSRFLTGTEGVSPGWDPLPWMIEETHKRGIEFHAWFNPYRVFVSDISNDNFVARHPEYVLNIKAGEEILNPGVPQVQQFIVDTVMEVVNKYDIDGVHFDDYFYPYGGLASTFDANEFKLYNPNKYSLADWRRENVNYVIRTIKEQLTTVNTNEDRAIKLGMSPFGVWANKTSHSLGSNTKSGVQSYSELYADSYKWIKEEWIDYIVPQVYWEFTDAYAPYADVVNWWANVVKDSNVNLFTGHSIYRYKESGWNSGPWANPKELPNQLLFNSKYQEITGSVYFRLNYLKNIGPDNLTIGQNELKNNFFKYKVLPPAFKNVDSIAPSAPSELSLTPYTTGNEITWRNDHAKAYYVYRFTESDEINLNDISKVLKIVYPSNDETIKYLDTTAQKDVTYKYYITAFDQAYNESQPSMVTTSSVKSELIQAHDYVNAFNGLYQVKLELFKKIKDGHSEGTLLTNNVDNLISELNSNYNHFNTQINTEVALINEMFSNQQITNPSKLTEIEVKINQFKQIQDDLNLEINSLKSSQNSLNKQIKTYKTTIGNSTFEISELEVIIENLTISLEKLNNTEDQLTQNEIDEINELNATKDLLVNQLETLKIQRDSTLALIQENEETSVMLNSKNTEVTTSINNLVDLKTNVTQLISNYTNSLNDLKTQILEQIELNIKQANENMVLFNELYQNHLLILNSLDEIQNKNQFLDHELEQLKLKLMDHLATANLLADEIARLNSDLDDSDLILTALESIQTKLNTNQEGYQNLVQINSQLVQAYNQYKNYQESSILTIKLIDLETVLNNFSNSVYILNNLKLNLSTNDQLLIDQINQLNNNLNTLNNQFNSIKDQVFVKSSIINLYSESILNFEKEFQENNQQLNELLALNVENNENLENVETKYQSLKEQNNFNDNEINESQIINLIETIKELDPSILAAYSIILVVIIMFFSALIRRK